jgi:anaerobic dimethyl sulfoxide reductase subunit C (anchor subunit)
MDVQWELIIFTLFITIGAGIFGVTGVLAALKKGAKIQTIGPVVALVVVAIGGVASFLHLQYWERAFNGFGHLTSGITQEMIAVVVFGLFAIFYIVLARRGGIPVWAGWVAVVLSLILVVIMAHSYNVAARPAWNTPLLWLYYLSNAVLFGGLICALFLGITKEEETGIVIKTSIAGGILTAVVAVAYCFYFQSAASEFTYVANYFDPTQPTKAMNDPVGALSSFATGPEALLFWGGVLALGAIVPTAIAFFSQKKEGSTLIGLATGGVICAIAGGVCFRLILYALSFSVFIFYR